MTLETNGGFPHLLVHEGTDADWQSKHATQESPHLLPASPVTSYGVPMRAHEVRGTRYG